jgi:hypothetical protein
MQNENFCPLSNKFSILALTHSIRVHNEVKRENIGRKSI